MAMAPATAPIGRPTRLPLAAPAHDLPSQADGRGVSSEVLAAIAERAIFRPRSRLWELDELHVPFDELSGAGGYEERAIARIDEGCCVAVIGSSGAGNRRSSGASPVACATMKPTCE